MSTFSSVSLNKSSSDTVLNHVLSNGTLTPQKSIFDAPKPSLRGMNKPKCIKCGNIARSRCDFQSCKGCCAKAQNPCVIHVLKQSSSILPDKPPPSPSPLPEQPPSETPSKGASTRLSSLRQLSTTYVNSLRAKKPLSRKDAIGINKWRFRKLREYIEGNVEVEDEAFDRYIQNVSLLEETFAVDKEADGLAHPPAEDLPDSLISAIKAKLQGCDAGVRLNRQRIQGIVENGLKKLHKWDSNDVDLTVDSISDDSERSKARKRRLMASRLEKSATFNDLIGKLARARTEEDFKASLDLQRKLCNEEPSATGQAAETGSEKGLHAQDSSNPLEAILSYSAPRLCTAVPIEQDSLSVILPSLDQIIHL